MPSVPGQVGSTISTSEKWLLNDTSLVASPSSASRSSANRSSVQLETPNPAIAPRSTCVSNASPNADAGSDVSSRCSMNTSSRSTPTSDRALSTSFSTSDGLQYGGGQPLAYSVASGPPPRPHPAPPRRPPPPPQTLARAA